MTSRARTIAAWMVMCATACGGEPEHERIVPEPARVERAAPEEAAPEETPPRDPSAPEEPPTPPPQPPAPREEIAGGTVERAIEPVEGAVEVAVSVARGSTKYVLFRWDGAAVARARILAEPGGRARLDDIDAVLEACDEADDYGRYDCVVRTVPDAYLAASELGGGHAWGVAVLEARGGTYVRTRRRFLFALSRDEGTSLGRDAALRVRDVDGDAEEELVVTLPIVTLRSDLGMGGIEEAVVAYVLDARDLRTQIRVVSDYTSSMMDVAGTTTTCRGAWRFVDVNHDGHDDVSIRARCSEVWQSEETGESRTTRRDDRRDCFYDVPSDEWKCGEPPIADWLFTGHTDGVVAEQPEQLGAALGHLGVDFEAQLARLRSEDDEARREDDRPAAGGPGPDAPAPPSAPRTCVHVVDDPAPPLRVRSTPTARAEIAGELPNGTELTLLERRGRWARIERPAAGWVWTENLRERCTVE